MSLFLALQSATYQGVLWGIMAVGVYITFRLLDIADMTCDGSFATGSAVCAVILTNHGNPIVAILAATLAGALAGFVTGLLHTKCKIPAILAGILAQLGLYSINLRIMGKSNIPLLQTESLYDWGPMVGLTVSQSTLVVGVIAVTIVIALLYWFFGTELGNALRATGNNEQMVRAVGVNTDYTKLLGLVISNALIALSGAMVGQSVGYGDVKIGMGAIAMGLASIVIGEVIFGRYGSFLKRLIAIIVGSIIYRIIIAIVIQLGLSTDDLKLLTAFIVALALTIPVLMANRKQTANYKKLTKEVDEKMLKIEHVSKTFNLGTINEKKALIDINLQLDDGDFVTVIGGNGAGKSTLMNMIADVYPIDCGHIKLDDKDISLYPEYKRAGLIGRVFQDPMMGTAADMQIDENLAMAKRRGQKRTLKWGIKKEEKKLYYDLLKTLNLGLEERMTSKVGLLSGGQRQALTLLMATVTKPKILLLDEHTAALDPATSAKVLLLTNKIVTEQKLTAMMVTHDMQQAIDVGNRLIMMYNGQIIYDVKGEEKKKLTVPFLLKKFEEASGSEFVNDRMLLK